MRTPAAMPGELSSFLRIYSLIRALASKIMDTGDLSQKFQTAEARALICTTGAGLGGDPSVRIFCTLHASFLDQKSYPFPQGREIWNQDAVMASTAYVLAT